jgi:hypothetical protein
MRIEPSDPAPQTIERLVTCSVPRVEDFALTGDGSAAAWACADWLDLQPTDRKPDMATRAKAVYSDTGLYVLMDCEDHRLTCTHMGENADLYKQDVVEFFIWPDQAHLLYLEYELSPLNEELVLLVSKYAGRYHGWAPWHYDGTRRTRHATATRGGPAEPFASVTGWSGEVFVPFALFVGFAVAPKPGDSWRANFYRIDHDTGRRTWSWSPIAEDNFHQPHEYGAITFA